MCQTNQSRKPWSSATSGAHSRAKPSRKPRSPQPARTSARRSLPFLLGRGPRVVRRTHSLQPRVEEDEAGTASGIGRREEHADARARAPVQSTARSDPDRVHDRPHVVHRRLQRLHLSNPIREARAALVEHEHAAAVGESLDVSHEEGLVPCRDQIAGDAAYEHNIRGAGADDLIRDRDVAASCVAHVWEWHSGSLSDRRSALHGIAVDSSSRRAWSWVAVRSQGGQTVALLRMSSHLSNPSPPCPARPRPTYSSEVGLASEVV